VRARIRFAKLGKVRFTSHRDVARIWERALRRAEVPVAYSEGFSPRPRLSFGLALSTGHESLGEYLDVDLVPTWDGEAGSLPEVLAPCLPAGFVAEAAAPLAPGATSLQQDVTACTWEIGLAGLPVDAVEGAVVAALAAGHLETTRTRKGVEHHDDVRSAIRHLEVVGPGDGVVTVRGELATQPRGLRPSELVAACFAGAEERRVLRTHQWIERDGARWEPLPLPAAAGAPVRARGDAEP
jgi:radical SAM-linked protein